MGRHKGLGEIHSAVILFGFAGLFGKWLSFSPLVIVLGRVVFASIALFLLLLLSKQSLFMAPARRTALLFGLGFVLSVHWVSFFQAIQVSSVAIGLLSYSSFPVFTAFLEPLFFREKLERGNIVYAFLCVFGVFLIIPKFNMSNSVFLGVFWGLLSGLTFAVLTILNRRLSQELSSLVIAFYEDLSATCFLLPVLLFIRPVFQAKDILLLLILGVACTAGAHTLFIRGIKHIQAQTAAIISSLEPVYGIFLALLFLHEIPSLRTLGGGLIIVLSVISITAKRYRHSLKKSLSA